MSEPIKIGIFVSIGLLLAIVATWDLLFGDRYGSTTYRHTSYTGQNSAQYSNETPAVSDETSDDTEDDSTQTKGESTSSTSYSYAAPNYSQTVNTLAEPVTQDSPLSGSKRSENKENARSTDSTQTLAVSNQSVKAQSTQNNQTPVNNPSANKIPSDKIETDAQDTAVRDELKQEDPDRQIARNSVQRLERSLQRSQNKLDEQPEPVATQTKNQAIGKTSAAGLTKVLNATETTREPNTDRALSISYQFDSEVMCAPPPNQVTKIDVLYRKNSYSIKGLSLYDIDRLVQLYRVCGGTLSISKNELPHAEPDTDLYTRRQNEVKYLLTQLRVKKGDMVFSDSETTDQ